MDEFLVGFVSVVFLATSRALIGGEGTTVLPGLLGLCFHHGDALGGGENSEKKWCGVSAQPHVIITVPR